MTDDIYHVPYSKTNLEFSIPAGMEATVAISQQVKPLDDISNAISIALVHPIGTASLRELAGPDTKVCIVFTDITRACPDQLLVPALLKELEAAGVKDENITLLCGVGMHRPSTQDEK